VGELALDQTRQRQVSYFYSAPDRGVEYCDERIFCLSVCLCVCLSAIISLELHVRSCFVHFTYGRGSVLLWRRNDTLCTAGFMDDVIFAHTPRLLDVAAQLKRCKRSLGLDENWAQ